MGSVANERIPRSITNSDSGPFLNIADYASRGAASSRNPFSITCEKDRSLLAPWHAGTGDEVGINPRSACAPHAAARRSASDLTSDNLFG